MSSSSDNNSNECAIADLVDTKIKNEFPFSTSTILITGGSEGLGLHLAKRFLKIGATVIVTGRRANILAQAKQANPGLITYVSDAGKTTDRENLFKWATTNYPKVNVLINNAGISRFGGLASEQTIAWNERANEIDINLNGPIHLSTLFINHFLTLKTLSFIANVTSGLAFVSFPMAPVYSATKAALHNYTVSLRWSLNETSVRVVEIAPPYVKTNLGGREPYGEDPDEWADHTVKQLLAGHVEIGFKTSDEIRHANRQGIDTTFNYFAEQAKATIPKYKQ